jgi:4-hydroxy-tetrahydrodipicolinate synthase
VIAVGISWSLPWFTGTTPANRLPEFNSRTMTLKEKFTGTGVAIVTPMLPNHEIDWAAFETVINHIIKGGAEYIVALGTTGESATIHGEEKQRVFDFVKGIASGRCTLMAGIGNYDTRMMVNALKQFNLSGYDAILTVSPYYNRPSQEGLYQHFKVVSENSPLPVMMYNVPGRTGQNMTAETQLRIARDFKNIFATKEASGSMEQVMLILKHKPLDFMVVSGDDGLALPMVACGANGVVSVIANAYPKAFSEMIRLGLQNKFEAARPINTRFADLIPALFAEGSPGGIKACLAEMRICGVHCRLPVVPVSEKHQYKIKTLMEGIAY